MSANASASALTLVTSRRRRTASRNAVAAVSTVLLLAGAVAAGFGGLLAPQSPSAQHVELGATAPSGAHWLGTDDLGRDIFSRILAGAANALAWPVLVALGAALLSTSLGLVAGYRLGWIDSIMMRVVDLMIALPGLLILIVLIGLLNGGYAWSVLLLTILFTPGDIRVIRSLTMAQRGLAYAEAARTLGLRPSRIMFRHLLPNIAPTVVAGTLMSFVAALATLSGLSFLGIGLPAGTPDWGLMVAENQGIIDLNPWAAVAPAALITIEAAAATLLGDWVFDRMAARGTRR